MFLKDNELYNIVKGKIVAVNDDGSYNVKVLKTGNIYPHVKNVNYKVLLKKGDITNIGLEHESKKLPIIMSNSVVISE